MAAFLGDHYGPQILGFGAETTLLADKVFRCLD